MMALRCCHLEVGCLCIMDVSPMRLDVDGFCGYVSAMEIRIARAQPANAATIAELVKELVYEIETAIGSKVFSFDSVDTETRARTWLINGTYTAFVAYSNRGNEVLGFLAVYESYGLYAEGAFGTIPELYVRPDYRSQGSAGDCWPRPGSSQHPESGRGSRSQHRLYRSSIERWRFMSGTILAYPVDES